MSHQWADVEGLTRREPKVRAITDGDLAQARVDTLGRVLRQYLDKL